jgi:aspartate carbamoyltransferase regulatory subunit
MNIDSIQNGIVIDHIRAGNGMRLYNYLRMDQLDCSVAIIQHCKSKKMMSKDIIKIDTLLNIDFEALGYLDPGATVTIIRNGRTVEKEKLSLPHKVVNVITCQNPRCITTTEPWLDQVFHLSPEEPPVYRCAYCEAAKTKK